MMTGYGGFTAVSNAPLRYGGISATFQLFEYFFINFRKFYK